MNKAVFDIKNSLKEQSIKIRELKSLRKNDKRSMRLWEIESKIVQLKYKIRHEHIAYCEMKGTSYDRIETPSPNNPPNRPLIEEIKKTWIKKIEDANVCCMSEGSDSESTSSSIRSCNC